MIRPKRLIVEGFRGFPQKRGFALGRPLVIVAGEQHQGKSSLLNAIEWCLFGESCIGEKTGIRERIGWEVVSKTRDECCVTLEIEVDNQFCVLERRQTKGAKRSALKVKIDDGPWQDGEAAERELMRIVSRSRFRHFMMTAYQHQETVRDIVTAVPKERNEAIDSLLGLADYRSIVGGLGASKVEARQRAIVQEWDVLQGRIVQALATRRRDIQEKRQKEVAEGLPESALTEAGALQLAGDAKFKIGAFAGDVGIPSKLGEVPARWQDLKTFALLAKEEVERLWSQTPDVQEQQELIVRRSGLAGVKEKLFGAQQAAVAARGDLDKFEADHGSANSIQAAISGLEERIKLKEAEISAQSPKAELVRRGIDMLQNVEAGPARSVCPLCGAAVPDLLEHLRKEWADRLQEQVGELAGEKDRLIKEREGLALLARQLAGLKKEMGRLEPRVAEIRKTVPEVLGRELAPDDDALVILQQEIDRFTDRLGEIEKSLRLRGKTRETVIQSVGQLERVLEILHLEEKKAAIEKIQETAVFRRQNELRDQLAKLANDLQVIKQAVQGASNDEAVKKIAGAKQLIDQFFRRLADNPSVKQIQVEVDRRAGSNDYKFRDHNGEDLTPYLSQGDLNCLALAILLGLGSAAGPAQAFGFLMLDDPSQSLGSTSKKRLAEAIDDICGVRKAIISTSDKELQELLETKVSKTKVTHLLSDWRENEGPRHTPQESQ